MKTTRRGFLEAGIALGFVPIVDAIPFKQLMQSEQPSKKLKILILGGTSFLGPHQIAYALSRGHEVSMFTRGKTVPKIHTEVFDQVERLVGVREDNLEAIKNRKWDVVIDNSGRKTQWTEDSAQLLVDQVEYYMYTSSISVFYPFTGDDFTESRPLITEIPADATESERMTYAYGVMKANSEQATLKAFGQDRSMIIRPTLIVGPGDRTDRFPYWVTRLEKGGEVIVPGQANEVVQYIDVRDLAEWMIRLLEQKAAGTYNASGPGFPMTTHAFAHGVHACFNSPIRFVSIDDIDFLKEHGVIGIQPWVIALPEYAGMSKSDNSKAIQADLQFRPLADTVRDTRAWWYSDAVSAERRDNILKGEGSFMQREPDIIAAWRAKG